MKYAVLIISVCIAVCTSATDTNIVLATQFEDGSTNTWTQSDLVDALGLMNRKYHRDMESDSGRRAWHGQRLQQYVLTNELGRLYRVDLYADGYVHSTSGSVARVADPEAKAKAAAAAKAKAEAIKAAWEAAHLPPEIAALRAAQRANTGTTNEVTVTITP